MNSGLLNSIMFANKGIKDMHCYVDSNLKAKEREGGKGGGGRGGGGREGRGGEGRGGRGGRAGEGDEGRRRVWYGKRRVIAMTRRAGIFIAMNFRTVGEKREVIPLCVCIDYSIYTISVLYNSEVRETNTSATTIFKGN